MRLLQVMLLLATIGVRAQTDPSVADGIAAFERGDFAVAAAILKPLVFDLPRGPGLPDPDPFALAYLGQMVRRGDAAPADWPLACALFRLAFYSAAQRWPLHRMPEIPFAADGINSICLPEYRGEVNQLMGAGLRDGLTRQQFIFDDGVVAVVDRAGFHLDFHGEHRDMDTLQVFWREVVASVTASDVSTVDERGRRIHYVEMFKWKTVPDPVDPRLVVRELHWVVFDLRQAYAQITLDQTILSVPGGPYPSTVLPAGVRDAAVLRPTPNGDVEWRWRGPSPARGIFPRR